MTVIKKAVIGMCFKCAKRRPLVLGHKVCGECHDPIKCHTCNKEKQNKRFTPRPERIVS